MTHVYSETEVVARVEGLTVARLRSFVAAECVAPLEREGRLAFREADLARLRLLADLVRDFNLDADAAGGGGVAGRPDPRSPQRAAPPRRGGGRRGRRGARPGAGANGAGLTGRHPQRSRAIHV